MTEITPKVRAKVLEMFSLAIADGFVAPEELTVIYAKGAELGLEQSHVNEIVQNPYSVAFDEPSDLAEAIVRLHDLGVVMASDGVIDERELNLVRSFARRFGIKPELVDNVVSGIVDEIKAGTSRERLTEKLQKELGQ
jgi:uncharacterized tellurite resistance protein B-like protein